MGIRYQKNHPRIYSKRKKRKITNSHYIAHSEPIFKTVRCLKITDMFSVAIWKFYFKLLNNKLSNCFSSYKPVLPVVNERYEIRNPVLHLPVINHKFAEQCLKYCLIRQLNMDHCSNIIADKVLRISFYSFKVYLKNMIVGIYKELCEIANCHVCNIVKNAWLECLTKMPAHIGPCVAFIDLPMYRTFGSVYTIFFAICFFKC